MREGASVPAASACNHMCHQHLPFSVCDTFIQPAIAFWMAAVGEHDHTVLLGAGGTDLRVHLKCTCGFKYVLPRLWSVVPNVWVLSLAAS